MSYTEACKGAYSKHKLYWINVFERISQKEKVLLRFTILSVLLGMLLCYAAISIISNSGLAALFLVLLFAYPTYVVGLGVKTMYALLSIRLHGVEIK